MKKSILSLLLIIAAGMCRASVLDGLMERLCPGLSAKIEIELRPDSMDFFELSQNGIHPHISANNPISAATGLNWYLKYTARVQPTWDCMRIELPDTLPPVKATIRKSTTMPLRYYLNYCTHSYSMAFWDWPRWEQEIDWMALHGINLPLAITGSDELWRRVLRRMDYPEERIDSFIAGPGYQAWWLMNNLEGWGGPNTEASYRRNEQLQQKILERMRQYGMEPVFAGYAGMVPHDAGSLLGLEVADPGKWLGYTRPAFLQPESADFKRIAAIYYDELERLYGRANYFSMDPFHEGGNTKGVNLGNAGRAILSAMKEANPASVWVIQGWRDNPRSEMIDSLPQGDLLVLDLHAETEPMWNTPHGRFGHHNWLYCMLHNFGGNIGLYGRIPSICHQYPQAATESSSLKGIGLTMEGIETNPVVYELMSEMPWRQETVDPEVWIMNYAASRYGKSNHEINRAWLLLLHTVYDCPEGNTQQGTAESIFCARPSDNPQMASAWAQLTPYYDPGLMFLAAKIMVDQAPEFRDSPHYLYDMVDVVRQAVADKGRIVADRFKNAAQNGDSTSYARESQNFLRLIALQDSLLATMPQFRLGTWTSAARNCGDTEAEKDRYEWNARTQITVWGNRTAANRGKLHDYAHREWQGLLADFYLPRWKRWFEARLTNWGSTPQLDFFASEEPWTHLHNRYSPQPQGDPVEVAYAVLNEAMSL